MRLSMSIALSALFACAGAGSESRWDDPVVHRLRLVIAPDPQSPSPSTRLRAAVEQTLRSHGFKAPASAGFADGVVHLTIKREEVELALRLPSGEVIDGIKVARRELPETQLQFESLAEELVVKFERSARVQTVARTGVLLSPP